MENVFKKFGNPVVGLMHGRQVVVQEMKEFSPELRGEFQDCADCMAPSTLLITELAPTDALKRMWGWCGKCDIGG